MNKTTKTAALLVVLSLPMLGACNQPASPATTGPAADATATAPTKANTMIGKAVEKGMRKAREELETSNLSLNGGVHVSKDGKSVWSGHDAENLPKAEITPQGDLLIEGKPVAIDSAQRTMLLAYRKEVIGVAEAGMAIGTQGAELAGKAMTEALGSIFDSDARKGMEQRMDAEGKKIEAQAKLLCNRLPAMKATQDKLAASLPEFKPYARMEQEDIDDCMDDNDEVTIRH